MTDKDKQILITDLCARLPYGVKMKTCRSKSTEALKTYMDINHLIDIGWLPYLRPMSSMTDKEMAERISLLWSLEGHIDEDITYKYQDWLNAHHFDYRGLIPMGLALEAPKDMYFTVFV